MRAHLAYFLYMARHKWFVFWECCRLGIPWLGLIHDWHKFTPAEWFPYVHYFYNSDGTKKQVRDKTGYYKPDDTGDNAFDHAWFMHQKRAWHHWQSWSFPDTNGNLKFTPMPIKHMKEMLADWRGAARAQGLDRDSVVDWYIEHRNNLKLHPLTRDWIQTKLSGGSSPDHLWTL